MFRRQALQQPGSSVPSSPASGSTAPGAQWAGWRAAPQRIKGAARRRRHTCSRTAPADAEPRTLQIHADTLASGRELLCASHALHSGWHRFETGRLPPVRERDGRMFVVRGRRIHSMSSLGSIMPTPSSRSRNPDCVPLTEGAAFALSRRFMPVLSRRPPYYLAFRGCAAALSGLILKRLDRFTPLERGFPRSNKTDTA